MGDQLLLEKLVFSEAFALVSLSVTIVVLVLNSFLEKAFRLEFNRISLVMLSVTGTYCSFIFAQTMYFSNVYNVIAPDHVLYPASVQRVASLFLFDLFACLMIVFLTGFSRTLWIWLVGLISFASLAAFLAAPF